MRGLQERFDEKYVPEPNSGYWLWTAGQIGNGYYGGLRTEDGTRRAHRISWELHRGPIPAGLCVLHKCDTPICVNPEHLFLGTHQENMADRNRKGRQARGITHARLRGTANGLSKLSEKQVRDIRVAPGTQGAIAARFGVSRPTVSRVKNRKVYCDV